MRLRKLLKLNNMDIKEAKNLYFNEIESFLKPKGFKVLKSRQIAERKNPIGFNQIFFDTVKSYDFTYSILCNLWVRNDKIQVIKGEIIPKRANPDKPTIITNIFTYSKKIVREDIDFEKHGGHLINFEDKTSIDKWITGFTRFINEAGFAFFDNFKTDADFDQWSSSANVSKDFAVPKPVVSNHPQRSLTYQPPPHRSRRPWPGELRTHCAQCVHCAR
jgi:hypothetical protein